MDINQDQAEAFRSDLIALAGWDRLRDRAERIGDANAYSPCLASEHERRFLPLLRLVAFEQQRRCRGGARRRRDLRRYYDVYALAASFMKLYDEASDKGKKKLLTSLNQALERGFAPLIHELHTSVWLRDLGYNIEISDHEGGHDFLATKEDFFVEVECKAVSVDKGRLIPRSDFYNFVEIILHLDSLDPTMTLDPAVCVVQLEDRLPKDPGVLRRLATACLLRLADEPAGTIPRGIQISRLPGTFPDPQLSEQALRRWVETQLGNHQFHCCAIDTSSRALLLIIRSLKPDQLVSSIKEDLKEARRGQFSGTRPAVLAVALEEVYGDELPSLKRSSALSEMVRQFFMSSDRDYLRGVCFVAENTIRRLQDGAAGQSTVLRFRNPKPSPFLAEPLDLIS